MTRLCRQLPHRPAIACSRERSVTEGRRGLESEGRREASAVDLKAAAKRHFRRKNRLSRMVSTTLISRLLMIGK